MGSSAYGTLFNGTSDQTLNSFSIHADPDSACLIDFYVLSSGGSSWAVEWSGSVRASSGEQYLSSGYIGVDVYSGTEYALVAATDCGTYVDLAYGTASGATAKGGFGDVTGYFYNGSYYASSPWTSASPPAYIPFYSSLGFHEVVSIETW